MRVAPIEHFLGDLHYGYMGRYVGSGFGKRFVPEIECGSLGLLSRLFEKLGGNRLASRVCAEADCKNDGLDAPRLDLLDGV